MSDLIKKAQILREFLWQGTTVGYKIQKLYIENNLNLIDSQSGFVNAFDKEYRIFDLKGDFDKNNYDRCLWYTYDNCITGIIFVEETCVKIVVNAYDGDLEGLPFKPKWNVLFIGNFPILNSFKFLIDQEWFKYLEICLKKEESERKEKRLRKIEKKLLQK